MERQSLLKRAATFLLTLCLLGTTLLGIIPASALAETTTTDIYFLNTEGWGTVGAYIYGGQGELLGSWGTTTATADSGNWVKVSVPAAPPYSIIFYNTANDSQRAELYLSDAANVYVTVNAVAFASKEAAEASVAPAEPATTVYFLNSNGWATVGAHAYSEAGDLTGGWGSTTASASGLGGNWVEVTVPSALPFNIIFFNKDADSERTTVYLSDTSGVYVTVGDQTYLDQKAAENAIAPRTTVYFLNSNDWANVGAHAYVGSTSLTGDWGSTTAATSSLGGKWVEVTVPSELPFSIIFFNKDADSERTELALDAAGKVYVSLAGAYTTQADAEASVAPAEPATTVYFLNSNGWATVGAHAYGEAGDLTGGWGSTTASASSLGGNWVEVTVPSALPFNIIFFNKDADGERTTVYLSDTSGVYVTVGDRTYLDQKAAENAIAPKTTVYFLNSNDWATVGAHAYVGSTSLTGDWGATTADVSGLGGKWVEVTVPSVLPFDIIFFNTADDAQRATVSLSETGGTYITVNSAVFATQADAEASVAPTEPEKVPTDIYFLNSNGWESVGAYIYGDKGELLGSWGATTATADSGNWVKVTAPDAPPYSIIFFNTANGDEKAELYLPDATNVYVTVKAAAFASKEAAEASVAPEEPEPAETYELYFLNSNGWESVGAYIYGDKGELLGGWGTTTATADSGSWLKVSVPAEPPYNVIFYNKADESQRAELFVDAAEKIYVTVKAEAFASKEAAEASVAPEEPEPVETYELYFLNSNGWGTVGAYIYGDKGELLGSWGTTTATADSGSWVKVTVSALPPYNVIFYNKADETQRAELFIDAAEKIYVTVKAQAFASREAAEASMAPVETKDLYFLNSKDWESVGAYIYGDKGELLGSWGVTTAVTAEELGGKWLKVAVPGEPPYSVIFYNKADETQRAELLIDAANKIYVTVNSAAYTSQKAAEDSLVPGQSDNTPKPYTLYFLNSEGWSVVGAYIYGDKGELLGGWGSTTAVPATELGGNWMKVGVSAEPPYNVIFYNAANDTQRAELLVDAADKIYVTARAAAFTSKEAAERSLEASGDYELYFLNSDGWETVGAYVYGSMGELLGPWGTTTAVAAPELGENWMKVTVSALPPYSVIFYNTADDTQRAELMLDASNKLYVTTRARAFTSQEAAEKSLDPAGEYEIYFLNSKGWKDVGAYIYGDQGELLGSWGSTDAVAAPELGEKWMKVAVPALPPYNIIFYNKADETQRSELLLDAPEKIYVTAGALAYATQEDAEAAEGVTAVIDPHNRDYGSHVEVIDTMQGKEPQSDNGISWLLPVGGVAVVALAAAALVLLKKKKQSV